MEAYKKVAILGVGLLGGSIGLALKRRKLAKEVVGHFRNPKKIRPAVGKGIIDRGTTDLQEAVRGTDIVVVCTPVSDIERKLVLLKKLVDPRTLVTDTGSTKVSILRAAEGLNFIGAHPLAGSEQSGAGAAHADLFQNSICMLTPKNKTAAWRKAVVFWNALGCRVFTMKAQRHDFVLSRTSHLPHLAAFALMTALPPQTLPFAAGGLKDTTRIALSSPSLWTDIFLANRRETLKALASYERALRHLKSAIRNNHRHRLLSLLTTSRRKRRSVR